MSKLITIVDDEEDILELVSVNLKKNGYDTKIYSSAKDLFKNVNKNIPDLIVLDLMLPDMDGYDICKKIKSDIALNHIPIIILSAKSDETDKIIGLELGADDYVTKPFSPKELIARVKAVLRRNSSGNDLKNSAADGKIKLDKEQFNVIADGKKVDVTMTEFKLLELLMSKKGTVFSRERILDYVWQDKDVFDRTVDVHIRHLREKLGKLGDKIKNIHGVGYKIED